MDMVMGMEFLEKNRIKQKLVVGVGFFELRNGDQDIYENNLIISYKNQDAVEAYAKAKAAIAYLQKWDDMSAERRDICESVLGCFFDIVNWMLIARDTVYPGKKQELKLGGQKCPLFSLCSLGLLVTDRFSQILSKYIPATVCAILY